MRIRTNILFVFLFLISACAGGLSGARRAGEIAKIAVDGSVNMYLQYCEEVRLPQCIEKSEAISTHRWTEEERIECLRPCDSQTSGLILRTLEGVRISQLALYAALKAKDEKKADEARVALRDASVGLQDLLRDLGVLDALNGLIFGGNK